ncbi:FAD-binding oxidoreductase [Litorisediminicola beolgyonensis]|uniref:FAD-dependent oxidoreductase n=1 Tax=Litorisediminicola beolgyonensis TaxID=1173614 RepID=A0ABW3ZF01_9RHOB
MSRDEPTYRAVGWGGRKSVLHRPRPLAEGALEGLEAPALAVGLGRSYGDVGLVAGGVALQSRARARFLNFDRESGVLAVEAGVTLGEIQRLAIPRGWALPVTPGTQQVTVAGAIANDVHGKNHARSGTFGAHVTRLRLARSDGSISDLGPEDETGRFAATIGGLGLTGAILSAEIQLRPVAGPWLDTETVPFDGLDRFFELFEESVEDWEYSVAWLDVTRKDRHRGLFLRANHADERGPALPARRQRRVPVTPPVSLIGPTSLRLFNALYYRRNAARAGRARQNYQSYFYPLDALGAWNRIYGPRGFYQYQSVVPPEHAREATAEMLAAIAEARQGSFLMVLKTFGARTSPGLLSFPREGTTLAMDFPDRGADTLRLFDRLDAILREAGGRIYPAKDARMSRAMFEFGYPGLAAFRAHRDPAMRSGFADRVMGGIDE